MPSSFSTNLGIEKPATGELSGTWGTVTNHNFDIFDRLGGYKSVTLSATSSTLTVREASPSSGSSNLQDGMYRAIKLVDSGDIGGAVTLTIAPNTSANLFLFHNGLSGSRDIAVTQGSGANVTVANGKTAILYCDGAGSGAAVTSISDILTMSNPTITGGSITGITDLAVADGGTGASSLTANGVLIGNGTSAVTAVDLSTKGSILAGDGSGNPQALAVGSDDQVLTADSSTATGLAFKAASGGVSKATSLGITLVFGMY